MRLLLTVLSLCLAFSVAAIAEQPEEPDTLVIDISSKSSLATSTAPYEQFLCSHGVRVVAVDMPAKSLVDPATITELVLTNSKSMSEHFDHIVLYASGENAQYLAAWLNQNRHLDDNGKQLVSAIRVHSAGKHFSLTTSKPLPKIIVTNNEADYWFKAAADMHVDLQKQLDKKLPTNFRYYLYNGTETAALFAKIDPADYHHQLNLFSDAPLVRGSWMMLLNWLRNEIEPPASLYPALEANTLITIKQHLERFPQLPGLVKPVCEDETLLVPAYDEIGNGIGGLRHPLLTVPMATYQPWNPAREQTSLDLKQLTPGSLWPLGWTKVMSRKAGDPRPSIEARHETLENYFNAFFGDLRAFVDDRYLLQEDAEALVIEIERQMR